LTPSCGGAEVHNMLFKQLLLQEGIPF